MEALECSHMLSVGPTHLAIHAFALLPILLIMCLSVVHAQYPTGIRQAVAVSLPYPLDSTFLGSYAPRNSYPPNPKNP